MKKVLLSVLAVGMLTACSQDETVDIQKSAKITFAGAFVENASRAELSADPSTTTKTLTGFDVWAFMDTPDGVMLTGDDVEGVQGNFSYAHTQYWIAGHDFYFAALAPMNSKNVSVTTDPSKEAPKFGLGTVEFTNVDGTEDLLYSATMVPVADDANLSAMAPVQFVFNHLLSKVKFTFKNTFTNPNYNFEVKNIEMVVPSMGTINLNQENWWSTNEWELDKGTTTLVFGTTGNIKQGKEQECTDERLTIPADATQDYIVTFDVDLYTGAVLAETYHHEIVLTGAAFEIGKAYDLYAELNGNNIDQEGALNPIVFDVQEVLNWEQGDAYGVGTNVATVDELVAALKEGGEIILLNDMTLPDATTISTDVVLNLNGKTLKGGKLYENGLTGTDISAITVIEGANLTIYGNGTIEGGDYGIYVNNGSVTVTNGTIKANTSAIQVNVGEANINGGTFSNTDADKRYVINCIDTNYKNNTAKVAVRGGTFVSFDPANNKAEGVNTNFVAPGYKSVADGENYNVIAE